MSSAERAGGASVRRRDGISMQTVDDCMVLRDAIGNCYALERSAIHIWQLLDTPMTITALCERLLIEYDVDAAVCERDVADFVQELHREGLVEIS